MELGGGGALQGQPPVASCGEWFGTGACASPPPPLPAKWTQKTRPAAWLLRSAEGSSPERGGLTHRPPHTHTRAGPDERYVLIRKLGSGSFGEIWEGTDTTTNETVSAH